MEEKDKEIKEMRVLIEMIQQGLSDAATKEIENKLMDKKQKREDKWWSKNNVLWLFVQI